MGAAFYMPQPEVLGSLREAIRVRPGQFTRMRAELAERGLPLSNADGLSRMPRGFEDLKDNEVADALRLKSLMVSRPVTDETVCGPSLPGQIVDLATDALPLLRFGWAAMDEVARATLA